MKASRASALLEGTCRLPCGQVPDMQSTIHTKKSEMTYNSTKVLDIPVRNFDWYSWLIYLWLWAHGISWLVNTLCQHMSQSQQKLVRLSIEACTQPRSVTNAAVKTNRLHIVWTSRSHCLSSFAFVSKQCKFSISRLALPEPHVSYSFALLPPLICCPGTGWGRWSTGWSIRQDQVRWLWQCLPNLHSNFPNNKCKNKKTHEHRTFGHLNDDLASSWFSFVAESSKLSAGTSFH